MLVSYLALKLYKQLRGSPAIFYLVPTSSHCRTENVGTVLTIKCLGISNLVGFASLLADNADKGDGKEG